VKGKKRYQTDELRELIDKLEEEEDKFKDALVPFLRSFMKIENYSLELFNV
jgi:hypothetical protein